jgi:glutathionyl-hydroquinone reductase
MIREYPNLRNFCRDMFQYRNVSEAFTPTIFKHAKYHYCKCFRFIVVCCCLHLRSAVFVLLRTLLAFYSALFFFLTRTLYSSRWSALVHNHLKTNLSILSFPLTDTSHPALNYYSVVPAGSDAYGDFAKPHDRDQFK